MFLINGIYFKGTWTFKFDSAKTIPLPFTVPGSVAKTIPMMHQTTKYLYYQNSALQMVDLPYGKGDFRMTVILPVAGTDIDAFIGSLSSADWSTWVAGLDSEKVDLSFPRFKLKCDFRLNQSLSDMGMGIAFTSAADFSRISDAAGLQISEVKHKTYIEVNEQGTEAAAVTIVVVGDSVYPPNGEITMNVNRPFIFVIRDAPSGTLMFIGKVIDPTL